jgi:UDP-N-acetylenolpyruvoylglucosamine reductase
MKLEEDVPLARYTTIGTGGAARYFAAPETVDDLVEVLRWAEAASLPVETIGLGSNLLVHDDGVDALVLKLTGDLPRGWGGSSSHRRSRERPAVACA